MSMLPVPGHASRSRSFRLGVVASLALTAPLIVAVGLVAASSLQGQRPPQHRPAPKPPLIAGGEERAPAVKGIWEPVNYTEDIALTSVFFVSPSTGWVTGDKGTIVKTTDGGAHWTAQLGGDPRAAESPIGDLRFTDETHGWATRVYPQTDSKLLRTTDGEHWEEVGAIPHIFSWTYRDYRFTTPNNGAAVIGHNILVTTDAGHTWKEAYNCETTAQVNGLSRNVDCMLTSLSFISPDVGFALGGNPDMPGRVFIVKTANGGKTWALHVAEGANIQDQFSGPVGAIAFVDAQNGVVVNGAGQIFRTADGGNTWRGVPGTAGPANIGFADPEVGWSISDRGHIAFTADGGQRWLARDLRFPASTAALNAPQRDRAYLVGAHGMVYRYRVVPMAYNVANAIDAPALPTVTSPLDGQVSQLEAEVQSFAEEGGGSAAAGDSGTAAGGSAAAAGSGAAAGGSASPGSATTGAVRGRASTLGRVQALLDLVGASMPQFLARYHNLNLVYAGARTSVALPGWLETMKQGLTTFRSASDKSAAAGALAQIMSAADSLKKETSLAFQKRAGASAP